MELKEKTDEKPLELIGCRLKLGRKERKGRWRSGTKRREIKGEKKILNRYDGSSARVKKVTVGTGREKWGLTGRVK